MPLLLALALVPLVVLLAIALMPFSLVQRYRMGKARRQARGWLATLNVVLIGISAALFLVGAGVTDFWVPRAFLSAAAGLLGGALLGVVGLWLSRWEHSPEALHYTPNRWLVLGVTLLVAGRIGYGFWRSWHAWRAGSDGSWLAAAGIAGSLAAGGVVLGYYLCFWLGVRRRVRRHPRARERSDAWTGLAFDLGRELLRQRRAGGAARRRSP